MGLEEERGTHVLMIVFFFHTGIGSEQVFTARKFSKLMLKTCAVKRIVLPMTRAGQGEAGDRSTVLTCRMKGS